MINRKPAKFFQSCTQVVSGWCKSRQRFGVGEQNSGREAVCSIHPLCIASFCHSVSQYQPYSLYTSKTTVIGTLEHVSRFLRLVASCLASSLRDKLPEQGVIASDIWGIIVLDQDLASADNAAWLIGSPGKKQSRGMRFGRSRGLIVRDIHFRGINYEGLGLAGLMCLLISLVPALL